MITIVPLGFMLPSGVVFCSCEGQVVKGFTISLPIGKNYSGFVTSFTSSFDLKVIPLYQSKTL